MAFFLMQAGTGVPLTSSDLQQNSFGITNISGAAGFFAYTQAGATIGSITTSQPVVTNNGPDFNYVVSQVAGLMNQIVGTYASLSNFHWCNDQRDTPPGSYLDVAYYAGMEAWSDGNVLAFIFPGNWYTTPGTQAVVSAPNQPGWTINGTLNLVIPPMSGATAAGHRKAGISRAYRGRG